LGIPEDHQGRSVAQDAYDLRRLHHFPTVRDTHGDSPQRPRRTPFASTHISPVPFSLLHADHLSTISQSDELNNDVFR